MRLGLPSCLPADQEWGECSQHCQRAGPPHEGSIYAGDVSSSVKLMEQLLDILDAQLQGAAARDASRLARTTTRWARQQGPWGRGTALGTWEIPSLALLRSWAAHRMARREGGTEPGWPDSSGWSWACGGFPWELALAHGLAPGQWQRQKKKLSGAQT